MIAWTGSRSALGINAACAVAHLSALAAAITIVSLGVRV